MAGNAVLIVDDNPINLKLAKILLVKEGYEVKTASSAEEALKMINVVKPQLVLMDIQLPGMDGLELTRHLKSSPDTKGIIVLALSAYAMKGDDEKAKAAGCDGYITKPLDTQSFPALIAGFLSGK